MVENYGSFAVAVIVMNRPEKNISGLKRFEEISQGDFPQTRFSTGKTCDTDCGKMIH